MKYPEMFAYLQEIYRRPKPFEIDTARELWNDPYISQKMLEAHLNDENDIASKNKEIRENSIDWLCSRFQMSSSIAVCDLGCGPGLYALRFAERGAQVTGVDFSERSIHYARAVAHEKEVCIDYVMQDYLQFSTDKKFDLIVMICYDFSALSPLQIKVLFSRLRKFLKSDGFFVFDVYSTRMVSCKKESVACSYSETFSKEDFWAHFWSDRPHYLFSNSFVYEKEAVLLDKYTIIEEARTREIFNWLQCYSLSSLQEVCYEHGCCVVEYYSDLAGTPYHEDSLEFAVVVKKEG